MATISFPKKLNSLNDVDVTAESDGDLLSYNGSTGQWSNTQYLAGDGIAITGGSGGPYTISLASSGGSETSTGTTTGLTASNEFFIACSGSVTGSVINVQLPLISNIGNGKNYVIKNVGVGIVNVIASGSNRIDGALSASIYTTYSSYSVFGTGSNWWVY